MTTDESPAAGATVGSQQAPGAFASRTPARVRRSTAVDAQSSAAVPADDSQAGDDVAPLELLPRDYFLAQLRREMRRADRSGSPLSIVVFRLAQSCDDADRNRLANRVAAAKRETDIVGVLGPGTIAALCVDTGSQGVATFAAKIDHRTGALPYAVECATYPDELFQAISAGVPDQQTAPNPLLLTEGLSGHVDGYPLKRTLDVVGASLGLLLLAPLMLIAALAIKLSSRGPVLYTQVRMGRDGKPFKFYKFRSMYANGDDRVHREYVAKLIKGRAGASGSSGAELPWHKLEADPRVTFVGRFIRRTSIDELPQLFNVLKGEMSLVGPRPPLPYEVENYQSWHLRRVLTVRPGITGLWQVEGRGRLTFNEMVRMDLRYITHCSLGLDLRLLVRTIPVVLSCDGAS